MLGLPGHSVSENGAASAPDVRDQILINEVRTELRGSLAAWLVLSVVTGFLAFTFAARAEPIAFFLWLSAISIFLTVWLIAWTAFVLHPPSDRSILDRWIPCARLGMMVPNLATAGSVWVFLPVAEPELRALMLVLYAWFLVIQFAAATEATQVLRSAVVLVLGSLTAWLLVAQPPYFLPLTVFMVLFGATLIGIRRFVRQAVVAATTAQAELALATASLERERDAKTHFIRAASHDLQQPLQAAALFLDRVKPGGRAVEQAPAIGGVRQALTAARLLVSSMLDHLKLEGGVIQPDMAVLTVGEVFERVLLTQGPAAAAAGVELSVVGRSQVVRADAALLARALENLVTNALRHAGGRRIVMGARSEAGRNAVTLWVVDDGRGLEVGDEERIFQPFSQGGHVGAAGGFGLGLASTARLVALMGGTCGVRADLTCGAAFYIRLSGAGSSARAGVRCAA
ncbi:MAG: HAMP domain-containing sensor histidine kinase [Phenylobacterium sp.]|nr:HAMP domain-containing sensor histidine kinase [Phenylobacterium sp.]